MTALFSYPAKWFIVLSFILIASGLSPGIAISGSQENIPQESQTPEMQEGISEEPKKERNLIGMPIVISNPAIGTGLGVTGMYFFDIGERTPEMPRSNLQVYGAYTSTNSFVGGVGGNLFMMEDRLRAQAGIFGAHINNDYRAPWGESVEFATDFIGLFTRMSYRIKGDHFLGAQIKFIRTTFDPKSDNANDYLEFVGAEDTNVGGIGPVYSFDSRDDPRYPTKGFLIEANGFVNPESWGNEETYVTVDGSLNNYHSLNPRMILASRLYGRTGSDNTPYSDKAKLGMRSDLRGFKAGEVVGQSMLSGQVEYRWRFYKKWGMVLFGGLAKLWDDDPNQQEILEDYYYGVGTGIRYTLSEENGVNLRFDIAVGNDDNIGWYLSLGEAF